MAETPSKAECVRFLMGGRLSGDLIPQPKPSQTKGNHSIHFTVKVLPKNWKRHQEFFLVGFDDAVIETISKKLQLGDLIQVTGDVQKTWHPKSGERVSWIARSVDVLRSVDSEDYDDPGADVESSEYDDLNF